MELPPDFHRGDPNADGEANVTDALTLLNFLFLRAPPPDCLEAGDTNDDGGIDIADAIILFSFLFKQGAMPAEPGPPGFPCGTDPEGEGRVFLGCEMYDRCEGAP